MKKHLEDYHHRSFRYPIIQFAYIVEMHDHTAPGEMARTIILPLVYPTMKSYASAKSGALQCLGAFLPGGVDSYLLIAGDQIIGFAPGSIIFVRIIELDPMPAIIFCIFPIEPAAMFVNDEVHTFGRSIISLPALLSFALTEADIILFLTFTLYFFQNARMFVMDFLYYFRARSYLFRRTGMARFASVNP
jgi:hypothetical protein